MVNIISIKFHGRAGEGVLTSSYLLAVAAFYDNKYSQSFPMFGAERMGAPIECFLRIDNKQINIRSQIQDPDYVLILDDSLLKAINVKAKKEVYINSAKKYNLGVKTTGICCGNEIRYSNVALISYFARRTKIVSLNSLIRAVKERFIGPDSEKNVQVVKEFYGK